MGPSLSFVRKDFIRQRVQRRGGRHNSEMESGEKMKILPPRYHREREGGDGCWLCPLPNFLRLSVSEVRLKLNHPKEKKSFMRKQPKIGF